MKGLRVIPHSTLKNDNVKDIAKGLHNPKRYIERYNFKAVDYLTEEGEPIHLQDILTPKILKNLLTSKNESDLAILQDNFIYEIDITNKSIDFRLLGEDLESIKKTYGKYIDEIKFEEDVREFPISTEDLLAVEMVTREHFLFSLKTRTNGLEPLRYILDLKRQLKPGERFIYQIILHSLDNEWRQLYGEAYKKYKDGIMPNKFKLKASDIVKLGGDISLKVAIEILSVFEEIIYGESELTKIDLTEDNVAILKKDKGISRDTINKGSDIGYEVAIRGLIYSKSNSRRDFIANQFKNCFSCLEEDNKLSLKRLKPKPFNLNRIRYREIISTPITSSKMILSASEVANLLYLPQITLQQEYNMERLDFREVGLKDELKEGIIPIGELYGSNGVNAYWSKVKDVLTLSKVFVGVKGSGKSKYLENYVYYAHKSGNCIIYFDYIENNQNALEVSKHIPKEDIIKLDLSKGFTFDYPELDITNIPKDEEYERTLKRISSEYCKLVETFINTINTDDTAELTGNMRNILVSACSFTFLVGDTALYSIYKILTDHVYRYKVTQKVKEMNIYRDDDFRFNTLKSLDVVEVSPKAKKEKVVGTNNKADRVLDRFNALMRDSRTEEMLLGIDRNSINFVDVFEKNKLVLILMPEEYFSDDELKDIVVTYFLSRMWLSALKRGALIPNREDRNVVHIVLDEVHKLKHATRLMIKNIAEDRKYRTTYIYTCQYLKQFGSLWNAVKGSGSHFMLLSGTEKENFNMLKEEIGNNFTLEELLNLPPRTSLNLIRYNGQNITSFISKLPPMLSDTLRKRGTSIKTIKHTPKPIEEDTEPPTAKLEDTIVKYKVDDVLINGKSIKNDKNSKEKRKKWYFF